MRNIDNNSHYHQNFTRQHPPTIQQHPTPFAKTFHKRYKASPLITPTNNPQSNSNLKEKLNLEGEAACLKESGCAGANGLRWNKWEEGEVSFCGVRRYKQTQVELSLLKLEQLIGVWGVEMGSEPSQMMQNVYNKNQQYVELLHSWQRQQIYDEIDKKVYTLTQLYLQLIENIVQQISTHFDGRLQLYHSQVTQLQANSQTISTQNRQLKSLLTSRGNYSKQLFPSLCQQLQEYYDKNQYSTFLLTQIQKNNFNLQTFAKFAQTALQNNSHTSFPLPSFPAYSSLQNSQLLAHTQSQMLDLRRQQLDRSQVVQRWWQGGRLKQSLSKSWSESMALWKRKAE